MRTLRFAFVSILAAGLAFALIAPSVQAQGSVRSRLQRFAWVGAPDFAPLSAESVAFPGNSWGVRIPPSPLPKLDLSRIA